MKNLSVLFITFFSINVICGQVVYIPDPNFKTVLLTNPTLNSNGDSEIQVSEANSYTGPINVWGLGIIDLTGIETFLSISQLDCSNNQIVSLDLSNNPNLIYLYCYNNVLTNLNISNNTALVDLRCNNNLLTNLNLNTNLNLESLFCSYNQITNLDVSNNINLVGLECNNNQLTSLNVSNNTLLYRFYFENNQITTINLNNNGQLFDLMCNNNLLSSLNLNNKTNLYYLWCDGNQLNTLDLNNTPNLHWLYCQNNQLSSIDLSSNNNLERIDCSNNALTYLNINNGVNTSMTDTVYTIGNPSLFCIQVDNTSWSTINWTDIDSWSSFSNNCSVNINENIRLNTTKLYPNPSSNTLNLKVEEINVSTIEIYAITGQKMGTPPYKKSSEIIEINISSLADGAYFLKIVDSENTNEIVKFIKNN